MAIRCRVCYFDSKDIRSVFLILECELSNPQPSWEQVIEMVSSIDITKVGVRGGLVIDLVVGMDNPNDYQFQPRVHLDGNIVRITNEGYADEFSNIELDDDALEVAERDRSVELRIKFIVIGMHGTLNHINPIPSDGKGKKLAKSSWKTVVPLL